MPPFRLSSSDGRTCTFSLALHHLRALCWPRRRQAHCQRLGHGPAGGRATTSRPGSVESPKWPLNVASVRVLTVDDLHGVVRGRRSAWIAPTLDVAAVEGWPLVVLATGLPSLTDIIDKYPNLQRSNWIPLYMFSEPDSVRVLQEAALAAGRRMEDETARLLARASGGFPYVLQMYGFAAWEESRGNDRIGVESAPVAIRTAASELDRAFYGPAWRQCSPRERDYLAVVAWLRRKGVPALGPDVAQKLGLTGRELSPACAHLIDNDLLMTRSGELEFALPGMVDYVLDRASPEHRLRQRCSRFLRSGGYALARSPLEMSPTADRLRLGGDAHHDFVLV